MARSGTSKGAGGGRSKRQDGASEGSAFDPEREEKVRERAYRLWEEEGRPEGRHAYHWERAREIVAIEETGLPKRKKSTVDPGTGSGEPVEPAEAIENAGEFPGLTDLGDESPQVPRRRGKADKPAD